MTARGKKVLWTLVGTLLLLLLLGFGVVPRVVGGAMNRTLDGAIGPVSADAVRIQETLAGADLHADASIREGWSSGPQHPRSGG